jgi:hypothetical protein
MKTNRTRVLSVAAAVAVLCFVGVLASKAQQPGSYATSGTSPAMDPERAQIWNSPNMLKARAWLQEYCQVSKKFTPEDEKKYLAELENLSASQMKLWLLKFDHEQEQRQQQYQMWQQAHDAAMQRAIAADKATQESYAAINQEESAAAGQEQAQLNEQQQAQQELAADKELDDPGPYGGPYGAYPGYGGIHYHFHLYPY